MKCKYCKAEMNADTAVCPECGKENRKTGTWKIIIGVVLSLALLVVLTLVILDSMGIKIGPRANDINYKSSYTVSDSKAQRDADKVIATVNGAELTNGEFQIHYWMQVYSYLNYYGDYYFDYTKPLDEQKMSENSDANWQQYFIGVALESWHRYQLLNELAAQEGYTLTESQIKEFADMPASLETMAKEDGFASADEMLQADFGIGCTVEDYVNLMKMSEIAIMYTEAKYEDLEPTAAELDAYYEENKEVFESSGVLKGGARLVDVRHILVQLDNVASNEDMTVTYTEDQWESCLQEAQKILDEWKNGENSDEASFGELAKKYSKDTTSTSGGLISQIYEGEMTSTFNDWIFDESRVAGETGIVKTVYGYHVIYFVKSEEEWAISASSNIVADKLTALIEEAKTQWAMEVNFKNIVLSEQDLS